MTALWRNAPQGKFFKNNSKWSRRYKDKQTYVEKILGYTEEKKMKTISWD